MSEFNGTGRIRQTQSPEPAPAGLPLPHSPEDEKAIIGAMMLDAGCIPEILEVARDEDFHDPRHLAWWKAARSLYERTGGVDLNGLVDEVRRTAPDFADVVLIADLQNNVVTTYHAVEQAKRNAMLGRKRQIIRLAAEVVRSAADPKAEPDSMLEKLMSRAADLGKDRRKVQVVSAGEAWPDAIAELEAERAGTSTAVTLGLPGVDDRLKINATSLTIVGARPSVGKTAFGLSVAYQVAAHQHRPVLFFSMEMGPTQLLRRLMAMHCNVPASAILAPRYLRADQMRALAAAQEWADGLPLHIEQTPGISMLQLATTCRRHKANYPDLGLIVIDYLGLMRLESANRGASTNDMLGEVSKGIKRLAMELHVPILCLHQLSRNVERRADKSKGARPMLADLRDSGHIEQDADNVLFLHRERADAPQPGAPPPAAIETLLMCAKQRQGPVFDRLLSFNLERGMFLEAAGQ